MGLSVVPVLAGAVRGGMVIAKALSVLCVGRAVCVMCMCWTAPGLCVSQTTATVCAGAGNLRVMQTGHFH